jgi:L-alanine-DL-glutamate epimerase-like enolase superfamily enzyme
VVDGTAVLPDSVGIGVAVDEEKVARYRRTF